MRRLRPMLFVMLVASLALAPRAAAATTYTDAVRGIEIAATPTQGVFVGTAVGSLPGHWAAKVVHTPLSPGGTITGGSFFLATTSTVVAGNFTGGTVSVMNPGAGCTNQQFALNGMLGNVGPLGTTGTGTGTFTGVLTHYRANFFGSCVTYFASITGSLTLTF